MTRINQGIASSIAEACNCSFGLANIVERSVLLQCRDSISAEVSLQIKPVKAHSVAELICQFNNLLIQHKNVIDLGKFTMCRQTFPSQMGLSFLYLFICLVGFY